MTLWGEVCGLQKHYGMPTVKHNLQKFKFIKPWFVGFMEK